MKRQDSTPTHLRHRTLLVLFSTSAVDYSTSTTLKAHLQLRESLVVLRGMCSDELRQRTAGSSFLGRLPPQISPCTTAPDSGPGVDPPGVDEATEEGVPMKPRPEAVLFPAP